MGTYNPRQLLADWGGERITADMAIGHILQHIVQLYELQVPGLKRRQPEAELSEVGQLQIQVDRLQQIVDSFIGLNLTVYQLRSEVDTLRAHLAKDNAS
jgi:hypothetical protein